MPYYKHTGLKMATADIAGNVVSCKEVYTNYVSGSVLFASQGYTGIMSTVSGNTVYISGGIVISIV